MSELVFILFQFVKISQHKLLLTNKDLIHSN